MNSETSKLWPALIRARQAIGPITKSGTNPHFGNKYAPLGEVLAAVLPALHAEGLALTAMVDDSTGSAVLAVRISLDDLFIQSRVPLVGAVDMQKLGGAMTYAMRYAIGMLLALELEDDDDGNKASQKPAQASNVRPQAPISPRPASQGTPVLPRNQGKRDGKPGREARQVQDGDAEKVWAMAQALDAKAERDGKDFKIIKGDRLGIYGKVAEKVNLDPGQYSLAQVAARGSLLALMGFYEWLCGKEGIALPEAGPVYQGAVGAELKPANLSNDDLLDAI